MSLLDDYEELCNAQDISIFRETLDEVLRPILITLEERYFGLNSRLDVLRIQIMNLRDEMGNLRDEMGSRLTGMETKIDCELTDAYEVHNTKLRNIWSDVLKIQSDIESIKLSLNK